MAWIERRVRLDRRRHDGGPPSGVAERRLYAERRLPTVAEHTISDAGGWPISGGRSARGRGIRWCCRIDRPTFRANSGKICSD